MVTSIILKVLPYSHVVSRLKL